MKLIQDLKKHPNADRLNICSVNDGEKTYHCKGKKAKAIDTTGAGDTFAGAFLHSINLEDNYEKATRISNIFAGEIISRFGARLPKEITKNLDNRLNI